MPTGKRRDRPVLSTRSALVLLIGVLVAVGVGLLTERARHNLPEAVLAGMATFPITVKFADWLIAG